MSIDKPCAELTFHARTSFFVVFSCCVTKMFSGNVGRMSWAGVILDLLIEKFTNGCDQKEILSGVGIERRDFMRNDVFALRDS